MHRLLKRQLRKYRVDPHELGDIVSAISAAYQGYDADLAQLETSLETSSQELFRANIALRESLKNSTAEAADANRMLESIVNNIREVIFRTDTNGNWTYLNPAWKDLTGYEVEESMGKSLAAYVSPKVRDIVMQIFKSVIDGSSGAVTEELRITTANGERKYLEAYCSALHDDDGRVIGAFGTLYDITDLKKVQLQMMLAKEEAERAHQAKAEFLSTMSHEIRTPMNAVIGVTHLLMQNSPRPDQLENLNTLKFSAENLLVIINDILDYNKIESGKIEFEEHDINIESLARSIKNSFIFKAEEKGIRLKVKIDEDLPEFVMGDSTRLAQVLTNLVGNAVKFTEKGSVCLDIEVLEEKDESLTVRFAVQDSGIGIPEEKIEQIFERFTQASASTTREHGGTGLGLSICKRLLELQQSDLEVNSVVGKGSTFWFDLRFKVSSRVKSGVPTFINHMPSFKSLSGLRVLLVEDNMINVAVTKQFFNRWEVEMDHAENGKIALEKLSVDSTYHLVLMDLQMPVMDGYQATRLIKENPKLIDIPVIALTASAMPDVVNKVSEFGMDDYLGKPFHPADLYTKLKQYGFSRINEDAA